MRYPAELRVVLAAASFYAFQGDRIVVIALRMVDEQQSVQQEEQPFWKRKTLEEMSASEWEQLCDGCGRCCLVKLEDEDNGDIYLTRLACGLLNVRTCKCRDYKNRFQKMPDCLEIDVARARELTWLPATCGYRVVSEGRDLAWWHPLISGSPETVHAAGISVRDLAMSERRVKTENYMRYIIPDFADDTSNAADTE